MSNKGLVKAAGIIGFMTLASRILGMIRDMVCARQFGTTWQWDAFLYAFMFPNFFRRVVGEGGISSAFVPVYSEYLQKEGKESAFRYANAVMSVLSIGLLFILFVVEVLIHVISKYQGLDERLRLALDLLRILFPYLFFISLYALGMGILNTHRKFLVPSIAPIVLNIIWIAGVLLIVPLAGSIQEDQLHVLAWILFVAGALQFIIELPALMSLGFRLKFVWDVVHKGVRKTGKLIVPAFIGFAITQLNLLIDMGLAYFVGPGANSSLWYGARLMQFPLGVFAIAMGTALLPTMSHHAAAKDLEAARKTLSFALRSVFFIILPCSMGLMALCGPIVHVLFERGAFDAQSTARTATVLFCYALGLFAYSGQKLMTDAFNSMQDTRTPVKIGMIGLASNLILNLILMQFLREAGLALATALSSILQFSIFMFLYHRKITAFPFAEVLKSFSRIAMASFLAGLLGYISFQYWFFPMTAIPIFTTTIKLFTSISLAAASYFGFCFLFRVPEINEASQWFIQRMKQRKASHVSSADQTEG